MAAPVPGNVIAWWADDGIACGVVLGEEKQRWAVVTAQGKDDRIAPSRIAAILGRATVPARTPEGRKEAAASATEARAALASLVSAVDVPTLWELVRDRAQAVGEGKLAELALGRADEAARLATSLALSQDGVRFARKTAGWQPREAVVVEEILAGRERAAARAVEKDSALAALARAARGEGWTPSGSESERKIVGALFSLAVNELETNERDRAIAAEAVAAAGVAADRPAEGAFRLLRTIGRFEADDENVAIVRFGLRTAFPPEVQQAAERTAAVGFSRQGRRDLTALPAITIDDARTREVDDALTIADAGDGTATVGIHIADPGAFIAADDPVDVEARLRGTTYYFPERKLLMIPSTISEGAASLVAGEDRPALSFFVTVDAAGRAIRAEIARSVVRVAERLDYEAADAILAGAASPHAGALVSLLAVAEARAVARRAAGAIMLRAPEAEIRVGADGSMDLTRRDPDTPAQRIVAEAMILAGEVAARRLHEARVGAIYRKQSPPDRRLPEADPALPAAVHVRATRRMLKRGEVSVHPGPHQGLGLDAYAQVTSPLRRYQDLALHRQLAALVDGRPPAYDVPAIQAILAATDRAEIDGRRAERQAARYWMLKWLAARAGATVTGVVVDTAPRPIVVLDETLIEEAVPSLVGAAVGDRVRLRVEKVNPRADVLVLRPS